MNDYGWRMNPVIKWAALLLCVTSALMLSTTGCTHSMGGGEKVGSVIKIAQEGFFIKTNEVELVRGGMNGGSGAFWVTPLHCTVNDDALLAKFQDALDKQYEVKVQYRDYFYTPISSDSNNRYCVSLQPFKP